MLAGVLTSYEIVDVEGDVPAETDLCILDERKVAAIGDAIARWKRRESPIYAPVLLLTERGTEHRWERYADVLGGRALSIQPIPAPKNVIRSRVESLLETRHYSLLAQRRHEELTRQNERLERFASIVSHDLQNPLSVAVGWTEEARKECDSDALARIEGAHSRMDTLLMDLLAMARAGTIVELGPCTLAASSVEAWEYVPTKEATLDVVDDVTVEADESQLLQLLENLFRNAVVHGGSDVTVRVGGFHDGFYVEDTGSGIPPEEAEHVLEFRYSTSDSGMGFGLNIVKQIVTAHGWEIDVAKSEEGGARFEITTHAEHTATKHGESRD